MKNAEDYFKKYGNRYLMIGYSNLSKILTEHDNEIISEIEKKIELEKQEMMDKKKELKKECIMEMWDSWETYYGGRTTALTEIINLIKET